MAYDESLADRVRDVLADEPDVQEKRMFGGICVMVAGHMAAGIINDDLMVRVGPAYDELLDEPYARLMDFSGRPMKGYLYVGPQGVATEADLRTWIGRALSFVHLLPPK